MHTQDQHVRAPLPPVQRPSTRKMFGPRCLSPLLDLRADQTVLFLEHESSLVQSVERRGALPVSVLFGAPEHGDRTPEGKIHLATPTDSLPLDDASVQHVVAPAVNAEGWKPDQLAELARVTAPGATLLYGASSRLRFPLRHAAQTPRSGRRLLAAAGFTETRVYGVRHGFHDPRFLVPMDHTGARTWFLASAYPPQKTHHVRLAVFLARLSSTRLDRVYFPQLLFSAKRSWVRQC